MNRLPCLDCGHELEQHPAGGPCVFHAARAVPILECDCHHTWVDHFADNLACIVQYCPCTKGRFTVTGYTAGRPQLCGCRRFLGPTP